MKTENSVPIDLETLQTLIHEVLIEHKTLAQFKQMSSFELDDTYRQALIYYQNHDMPEALSHFTYLVMHDPWQFEFMFGLASTLHALNQFESALVFYGYATLMNACDAGVTFRIGQCYLSLGKTEPSISALQTSIEQSYLPPIQLDVRVLAQSLLDEIVQY
ncbi:type III secretion protein [Vibrio sp. S4M6]|uniref:type III secretion protein n=1 Tax=Vibrio sinus TaxID=2946865 RepID=UPI002029FA46|nr:type III secretion protein [Vibrio sinus]MCL9780668.1 type III secretion protein [Vibrio sinus]